MTMAAVIAGVGKRKSAGDVLLTIKDIADHLAVSTKTVARLINDDSLHAIDISGGRNPGRRQLRVALSEVQRFLGINSTHKPNNENV